jgi:hypothetical protein
LAAAPKLDGMRISTNYSKQRGVSALETSFAVVPVLLVCMLGLEFVHAHQTKQLVSLALHEAARTASVTAADHQKVERAFSVALSPLFTPAGQHANPLERQQATTARYRRLYALPLWQLELTEVDVWDAKPDENRAVQLELIYLHEPLQSWLRKVLQQSARWLSASPGGLTTKAQQQGLIILRLSRRVVVHSNSAQPRPTPLLEDTLQPAQQDLNEWEPLMQGLQPKPTSQDVGTRIPFSQRSDARAKTLQTSTLAQTAADSRPKARLDSIAGRADPGKTSSLVPLRQESEQEELCGVLLCCAP